MSPLRLIGDLKYKSTSLETQIPVAKIRDGSNQFEKVYSLEKDSDFEISCLKSGDHREDSGFYFRYGAFDFINTIDANLVNNDRFPHKTTIFAYNFLIGSGEYPVCFDFTSEEENFGRRD
jgi:hypothetical protein